jgi:hypothetical protein
VGCNAEVLLADYQSVSHHLDSSKGVSPAQELPRSWWRSLLLLFWARAGQT